jgi:hypothetical protein
MMRPPLDDSAATPYYSYSFAKARHRRELAVAANNRHRAAAGNQPSQISLDEPAPALLIRTSTLAVILLDLAPALFS